MKSKTLSKWTKTLKRTKSVTGKYSLYLLLCCRMDKRILDLVGPLQDEIKVMAQAFEDRSDDIVSLIDDALSEKGIDLSLEELEAIADALLTGTVK